MYNHRVYMRRIIKLSANVDGGKMRRGQKKKIPKNIPSENKIHNI